MSTWVTVLGACALAYALKLSGYFVPARWLAGPRTARMTALLPAALLAGLIVLQTVGGAGGTFTLDARLAALGVAVLLLWRGANFLLVVAAAAVTAALLRLARWA